MRIRPHAFNRATKQDVAVFIVLGRLIAQWRDDPEMLAVAAWAYEHVLGYSSAAFEAEYNHPDMPSISREKAFDLVERALHRRNRKTLQHRAEGLVLAIRALALDAEFARLHGVREESAQIECRWLSPEERVAKLAAMRDE